MIDGLESLPRTRHPACIMLVTTIAALAYQLHGTLVRVDATTGPASPSWFIAAVVTVLIGLALVVFWERVWSLRLVRDAGPIQEQAGAGLG